MPEVVKEEVLEDCHGKRVIKRYFRDSDGQKRDFLLWGGKVNPVIVLPVTQDKKVIAIRSFRRAANEYLIEIPGGIPRTQEGIEACCKRELLEETGYAAGKVVELGPAVWFDPAACLTSFVPLLALDCQEDSGGQRLDESEEAEAMEVMLVDFAEWIRMIHSGEIRDAKTIVATFLALQYL